MKFTLETIKKTLLNHQEQQHAVSFSKLKGEINGFEKQERKRLEDAEKKLNVSADVLPFKSYERGSLAGYVKAKKEILENEL